MAVEGLVRLRATYVAFDRRASMTFHFRDPAGLPVPSGTCRNLADAYGTWENTGFGLGFALLRSEASHFVKADAWAELGSSRDAFVDTPFGRPGLIPGFAGKALPTSMAPIIHWHTADGSVRAGRTYVPGLTTEANADTEDLEVVNGLYRTALAAIFGALGPAVGGFVGYEQVIVSRRRAGSGGILPYTRRVIGCDVGTLMGSQRRRTRPGR